MEKKPQGRIQGSKFNTPVYLEIIGVVGRENMDEETK